MIRRKGPILAVAVIAAFALGWYRGLFGVAPPAPTQPAPSAIPSGTTSSTPAPDVASTGERGEQQAAPSVQPPAAAAPQGTTSTPPPGIQPTLPAAEATPAAPGFDVVRVEPDGSAVVAGKGVANETIKLTDGTRTFGETRTDANGDFVMTLSLPKGSHRLQLAQRDDAVSDDAAVVNVPPAGKPDELLVMMQRPGEASEILQRPTDAPVASAAAEADPAAAPVVGAAPSDPGTQLAASAPSAAPGAPITDVDPAATAAAPAGLAVEAVEIEGDRLFVAGSAKDSATVRIYLDDQPIADARSGAGDRFIATARVDVAVGEHTIRADALDAGGRVVGRVEVPFQRPEGNAMAAIAAAPEPARSASSDATGRQAAPSVAPSNAGATSASGSPAQTAATGAPPVVGSVGASSGLSAPGPASTGEAVTAADVARNAPGAGPAAATLQDRMSGEPQAVRQAPLQASPARVIIRRGDTLWRISREIYGRGSRYTVIYLANGDQIRDPNRIYPGQVFRVPDSTETEAPRG